MSGEEEISRSCFWNRLLLSYPPFQQRLALGFVQFSFSNNSLSSTLGEEKVRNLLLYNDSEISLFLELQDLKFIRNFSKPQAEKKLANISREAKLKRI